MRTMHGSPVMSGRLARGAQVDRALHTLGITAYAMENCLRKLVIGLLAVWATGASAQEAVKHIGVFVEPYYRAAASPQQRPSIAVARAFDDRLSQNDPTLVKAVEREIRSQPELVTPMTLMVLSIRLYDLGFRDESVFWHYAAKDRMRTIAHIVSAGITGANVATRDFAATAGPIVNGYAFCDTDKQRTTRRAAFEWVRDHPYQAIFLPQLPSPFADRAAALRDVVTEMENDVKKEAAYLGVPKNLERLKKVRAENGADRKYCW